MATKAYEYRLKASECEWRARQTVDPETRWHFTDMARQWRKMAEQRDRISAEQKERDGGVPLAWTTYRSGHQPL